MFDLYERQMKLEEESVGLGMLRYKKELAKARQHGREADLPPGLALINKMVVPMSIAMHMWIDEMGAKRTTARMASTYHFLKQFDPDMLAVVAAREVINGISKQRRLQAVALSIVGLLEDELEYMKMKEEAPGLFKTILNQTRKSTSQRHKRTVMMLAKRRAGIHDDKMSVNDRLKVGLLLVEKLRTATGFFKLVAVRVSKNKTLKVLRAEPSVMEWLEKAHDGCQIMNPVYMPMLVPPVNWTSPDAGGYLNPVTSRVRLFKVNNRNYIEELRHQDLTKVYDSVNALQQTAWKINKPVYDVMMQVWDSGGALGGLPHRDNEPLPARPHDIDTNEGALKTWKRAASKVHEANARLESKRVAIGQKLNVAGKFVEDDAIYFPWTLDWRGRAYPVVSYVHPQADDSGKALLTFAEGKPLGETGVFWLAVHIANLFGVDKCSFEDRVAWVQDNTDALMDSAMFPLEGQRFWATADKPYCALAACYEWLGCQMQGEDYVSHLPIAMDGSCNGLQNFSAMLKDGVGGKAVNLVPSDQPQDIYNEVREVVIRKVAADCADNNEFAALWVGDCITRSLVKRPVMTLPYGATKIGMRDQLLEHLKKVKSEGKEAELPATEDPFRACMYLATVIYDAIGEVVIAAREAMDWLQESAREAAKEGLPVRWTTPIGLPVLQMYRKQAAKVIRIQLGDVNFKLQISTDGNELDKRRQSQGIAPNFVHSLDASHMMLTVLRCREQGIKSFAMVHDSYGVLAADCELMYVNLRGAFVSMYRADVLGTFKKELESQLADGQMLSDLPPSGDLYLPGVEESQYFFA